MPENTQTYVQSYIHMIHISAYKLQYLFDLIAYTQMNRELYMYMYTCRRIPSQIAVMDLSPSLLGILNSPSILVKYRSFAVASRTCGASCILEPYNIEKAEHASIQRVHVVHTSLLMTKAFTFYPPLMIVPTGID